MNRLLPTLITMFCLAPVARAQAPAAPRLLTAALSANVLPEAPTANAPVADPANAPAKDQPSKRILGLVPNYRAVPVNAQLPRQTVRDKFLTAGQDTIDPSSFALAGVLAGVSYLGNATPEFHRGGIAFGRYYWHELADQSVENLSVEFLVPALAHEDTRYYTLGTGGGRKRLVYSLTRTFVTRSDSGKETFNAGEVVGAGIAAAVSSRYYPATQKTASSILGQYALDLGIDAGSFVLREFDSDLIRSLSKKHGRAHDASAP